MVIDGMWRWPGPRHEGV